MYFTMTNSSAVTSNSGKIGGFTLEHNKSIVSDVGKIEIQTTSDDGKIGRVAFYDRNGNVIVDIKGS